MHSVVDRRDFGVLMTPRRRVAALLLAVVACASSVHFAYNAYAGSSLPIAKDPSVIHPSYANGDLSRSGMRSDGSTNVDDVQNGVDVVRAPASGTRRTLLEEESEQLPEVHPSDAHKYFVNCTYAEISKEGKVEQIDCAGEDFWAEGRDEPLSWHFWTDVGICTFCVCFAGAMSGLTLGLLSLDSLNLRILANSSHDPKTRKYARRIQPLIIRKHILLVTLLLANAAAMEALPIFLDRIVGPVGAILISISAVLLFGEVFPQAVCSRYGLAIGATLSPLVWFLMLILLPVGWPLAKILDCLLGQDHGTLYRRAELKELIELHAHSNHSRSRNAAAQHANKAQTHDVSSDSESQDAIFSGDFTAGGDVMMSGMSDQGNLRKREKARRRRREQAKNKDPNAITAQEATIIKGALDMTAKTVGKSLTPLDEVFMLPDDAVLNQETLALVKQQGYNRVPIYSNLGNGSSDRRFVIGILMVPSLVGIDASQGLLVKDMKLNKFATVPSDLPLYEMLQGLRTGKFGHMALVAAYEESDALLGIITLEDVLEELIQADILDEKDMNDALHRTRRVGHHLAHSGGGAQTEHVNDNVITSFKIGKGASAQKASRKSNAKKSYVRLEESDDIDTNRAIDYDLTQKRSTAAKKGASTSDDEVPERVLSAIGNALVADEHSSNDSSGGNNSNANNSIGAVLASEAERALSESNDGENRGNKDLLS